MNVETLIYAYLAVCAAMIVFNIVCIFIFHQKDRRLDRYSSKFTQTVKDQIECDKVEDAHRKYLSKKLRRISNLMAFDKTLEELYNEEQEKTTRYIESLTPVFVYLTIEYQKKNKLQAAYFPYIIKKYKVFQGQSISIVIDAMLLLLREPSLYCRENAMQALYVIGDAESILKALRILDNRGFYHYPKMITDGLLAFSGSREKLAKLLWAQFHSFSEKMQISILDYFRFHSGAYREQILRLMLAKDTPDELRYSCIRYFGKYSYEPAYPYLMDYAGIPDAAKWEYVAISASALAAYPNPKTMDALKSLLGNRNWYVRFNASQSLETLGLEYTDLIDVFEGEDRYAGEIMRYRLDQKKMLEKEGVRT